MTPFLLLKMVPRKTGFVSCPGQTLSFRALNELCLATNVLLISSEFSSLLSGERAGGARDPASLPSVGAVSWRSGQVAPLLRAGSPVPLVTALVQLVRAAARLHPGLADTVRRGG